MSKAARRPLDSLRGNLRAWLLILACGAGTLLASPRSPDAGNGETGADCLRRNGIAYGPFRDGQGPGSGVYPTTGQIEEDLASLRLITRRIRTYSATASLAEIPRLARKLGISVSQGIHLQPALTIDPKRSPAQTRLDEEERRKKNQAEIAAGLKLAHAGLVDSLIVGNETLTLDQFPKEELVAAIRQVRAKAPAGVPVTTAEMLDQWEKHPDLAGEVDFALVHFYPFWNRHPIKGAVATLMPELARVAAKLKARWPQRSIRIVIGETGWPASGKPIARNVQPNPIFQRQFFDEFTALACSQEVPFYYFSAFDEEWKWSEGASGSSAGTSNAPSRPPPSGDQTFSGRTIGGSWGLIQADGKLKPQFNIFPGWQPPASRRIREIFVGPKLAAFYNAGVDTKLQRSDWLEIADGELRMRYPAGQSEGYVSITVDKAEGPRSWKDFSQFEFLTLELRGETGTEAVEIGIKHRLDRNDGKERRVRLSNIGKTFTTHRIPLVSFASTRLRVPKDLNQLHVVAEFVFFGPLPQVVYVRNIRYEQSAE